MPRDSSNPSSEEDGRRPPLEDCPVPREENSAEVGDFNALVWRRIRRDSDFASAVLAGAVRDFCEGDSVTAQLMLRDFVKGTIGFEELGRRLGKSPKSLMRMLSVKGNPRADNLAAIIAALASHAGLRLVVQAEPFPFDTHSPARQVD